MVREREPSAESKDPCTLYVAPVASGISHDAVTVHGGKDRAPCELPAGPLPARSCKGSFDCACRFAFANRHAPLWMTILFWRSASRVNDACKILHLDTPTARWDARCARLNAS